MQTMLDKGIEISVWVQSLGSWLLPVMLFFSFIGSEPFFLFLAPTIYWCLDPVLGIRAGLYLLINGGVNSVLKILFHSPRPYWYSADVKALSTESSFGMPSGHAQTSVVVWGTIAHFIHRQWVWIIAILLMFFIGFSRVYLGVHFAQDVIVGWIVGAVLLWIMIRMEAPFLSWFNPKKRNIQILFIFGISLVFVGLFALFVSIIGPDVIPQTWVDTAALAVPGKEPINPLTPSPSILSYAGAFFGMAIGALWIRERGWFSTKDPIKNLILRYVLGLLGVIILYSGLGSFLPHGQDFFSQVLGYIRYALVGYWITGGAPTLFIRLNLAKPLL